MELYTTLSRLIISYCYWDQMDLDKVVETVENGSNVVIWFAISFENKDNKPFINPKKLDPIKINKIKEEIKLKFPNRIVKHLISIGGWNAPHINTDFTEQEWFNEWLTFNKEFGFDGIDFDIEGNDDINSEFNKFSIQELDLIGKLAKIFKRNNLIVSIAPSQSYLDCDENDFSLDLLFTPKWIEYFPYHGKNVMAYVLAKYIDYFDFISLQLYEGWSRANYYISNNKLSTSEYFVRLVTQMQKGWLVKFSNVVKDMDDQIIKIPKEKLVIGLANGWAGPKRGDKFMLLFPDELENAYKSLYENDILPYGFMFWSIRDENVEVEDLKGNKIKFSFAKTIKKIYEKYETSDSINKTLNDL